jgi:hypothetical protein
MLLTEARIIIYDSRIVIYSFIVLRSVIMIVNYDRTVIMTVNYDHTGIMTVNCDRKIFYSTGHWCQCYKAFYVRNLRMFVVR